jgi:3-(3-hydroxy-phenyl)propionate hydroxylase
MRAQRAEGAAPPPLRSAPFAQGCILAGSPGAGELFPQPTCGAGVRRLRLDDALGDGPWLIGRRPQGVRSGVEAHDVDEPVLSPFRSDILRWLDARGADAVLVRPDRYVFGTGEAGALVSAWAAALNPLRQAA